MLDRGADVHRRVASFHSLNVACCYGHLAVVQLLLDKGAVADLNVADYGGDTPIANAKANGYSSIVALLEEHINPLHAAAKTGDIDAMTQLLDDGAEVDRANEKGRTPLWIACLKGHVEVARLLLEKGA